jgi:hypothetical protein
MRSSLLALSGRYGEVSAPPPKVLVRSILVPARGGERMASSRKGGRPVRPPATTPEGRENQLIASAYDLAEKQIAEGKASSQVLTHFLKMGTTREKLEQERIRKENLLLEAKVDGLASVARIEELYAQAIEAIQTYRPPPIPDENLDD